MDKSVLSVSALSNQSDDRAFWHRKTPEERLAAMELMRAINYGYDPATTRLQRVLTVTQLENQ